MPATPDQIQKIQQLRRQRDDCQERLYAVQLGLAKIENLLQQAQRNETAPAASRPLSSNDLQTQRGRLQAQLASLQSELAARAADPQTAIQAIYVDPHPRASIGGLNDGVPFLLLPVRIETRFVTAGRTSELLVRVYPDDVAIHTHEALLTDKEAAAGAKYWTALFDAIKNGGSSREDLKKAAWNELASSSGPQRAAWIAAQTQPLNWTPDLAGLTDAGQLQFPVQAQTKTHAWTRAPRTRVMPDKFVVMLYQDGTLTHEVVGEPVPDELFVGPDPLAAGTAFKTENGQLLFGAGFDWTSDFDKAVQIGMGFRIPLTPSQATTGFDRILVLGASLSADATAGQERLEELLDNHHYSPKGFSLLLQGTATNNTAQVGSGYSRSDPLNAASYAVETGDPAFDQASDCDGRNLADALGIRYAPLQHILNAGAVDYRQATLMNKALYPATLGYFFETLLQPVLTPAALEAVRAFFVDNVTGRGPLPALRVGEQPYGVLLTSDFRKWKWAGQQAPAGSPFLNGLYGVLSSYQQLWDSLLNDLLYVGKPGQDPDAVIMNILGLQPGSVSFDQRTAYSSDYLKNLDDFQYGGRYAADIQRNFTQKNTLLDFLSGFGYNVRDTAGLLKVPQALRLIYQHYTTLLDAANLVDDVPLSEQDPIRPYDPVAKKNYLNWLAETATIDALERQDFGAGRTAPNALLYLELRRALLLELHKASVGWFNQHNISLDQTLQPANFQNIRPGGDLTKYEVMRAKVGTALPGDANAALPVSEYLLTAGQGEDVAKTLVEIRAALAELAGAGTAGLERSLTEHLDACSYRLDAWQTGMFRLRLLEQRNLAGSDERQSRKMGVYLGAYGWLENVRPAPRQAVPLDSVPEKLRPADNQGLFEYTDNEGFVHTPSLNHAAAAAVLRSGYASHADQDHPDVMAVNLSSERVRRALSVLAGMRNGQTLEALLGYQFERGLHDRASAADTLKKLNLYIYDFRDKFPCEQHPIPQQGSAGTPAESLPATNVVNGVTLADVDTPFPYGASGAVTSASTEERAAVEAEKDRLDDTLDALKDLLLAESAYQMVQGNYDRSGAVLDALKEAEIPPELDVVNTPRSTRLTFTNRVTLHFEDADPNLPASNPWAPIAMTPRAQMEAGLNKWLGTLLGAPAGLVFRTAHLDDGGNEAGHLDMSAADLALQPIDLVYITGDRLNTGTDDGAGEARTAASELESRIAYRYRQTNGLDDATVVRIEFLKPVTAGKKTLGQALPLLRMLKALIADSRALHAGDFDPPSKSSPADPQNPEGYDPLELQSRVGASIALLETDLNELGNVPIEAVVKDGSGNLQTYTDLGSACAAMQAAGVAFDEISYTFDTSNLPVLESALIQLAGFGLSDAFPHLLAATTPGSQTLLLEQARSVLRRGKDAHDLALNLQTAAAAATQVRAQVDGYVAAGKAILGDVFTILPRFAYNNGSDIQQADADRAQLLKYASDTLKMDFPADEWLQSISHVRPRSARWDNIRMLVEAFGDASPELSPIQLPYRAGDSWLAVEFPALDGLTNEPFNILHDTLSVIAHGGAAFATSARQSGLLIDDWTEVIPTQEELTGLAFNYDRPNACPPQTLLLAVTPQETGQWVWDDLVGILEDTLQRAKRRAVEPLLLDKLDRPELSVLLPAIVADFSQYDLNISLDYRLNLKALLQSIPITPVAGKGNLE